MRVKIEIETKAAILTCLLAQVPMMGIPLGPLVSFALYSHGNRRAMKPTQWMHWTGLCRYFAGSSKYILIEKGRNV